MRMTSPRGEAPSLNVTHIPVGRTVGIAPSPSLTNAGAMTYVRRPQFSPLMLARNRLAGDDQDDLAWPPFNPYWPSPF